MRRLPLTFLALVLSLACGDDIPDQELTSSTGTAGADTGSSTNPLTTTFTPTTDGPTTTGLDSSTGPAGECGNGIVEDGEQCDDSNLEEDDDCYSNCTIPFEALWTQTYDGGDDDFASDALFDDDGNLYVLGSSEVEGQGYDLWLQQYLPDGSEGWAWTYGGGAGEDDFGRRLAWHDSGDLLIVGSEVTATEDDILVIRLGIADQVPVWIDQYDGPGMGMEAIDDTDFGNAIYAAANGDVLVAGTERVDGQEYDMWLRRYDADGNEVWTISYDNDMLSGVESADAVLEDAAGDIYLAGNTEVAPGMEEGWVRKVDADGVEIWTEQLPGVILTNGELDPAGNLVLVGIDFDNPMNPNMWIGHYDPDFGEISTAEYDGPAGIDDVARGVAVGGAGDTYVTGFISIPGEQANIWAGRYQAGLGLRWWSDSYGNEDSMLADIGIGIEVNGDESRVAVVGFESVIGQDGNVWVRMYQNNPVPLM